MICSLCLKEIKEGEEAVAVDGRLRHKSCSEEFEKMVGDLSKLYETTCPKDI